MHRNKSELTERHHFVLHLSRSSTFSNSGASVTTCQLPRSRICSVYSLAYSLAENAACSVTHTVEYSVAQNAAYSAAQTAACSIVQTAPFIVAKTAAYSVDETAACSVTQTAACR